MIHEQKWATGRSEVFVLVTVNVHISSGPAGQSRSLRVVRPSDKWDHL